MLRATYISVPQVRHTYACVLLKPHWIGAQRWAGMSLAEYWQRGRFYERKAGEAGWIDRHGSVAAGAGKMPQRKRGAEADYNQ